MKVKAIPVVDGFIIDRPKCGSHTHVQFFVPDDEAFDFAIQLAQVVLERQGK